MVGWRRSVVRLVREEVCGSPAPNPSQERCAGITPLPATLSFITPERRAKVGSVILNLTLLDMG